VRRAADEHGVTLIELLVAVLILGAIAVPLTGSVIVGLKTTDKAQAALDDGAASDLLSIYLAPDVQNTDPAAPVSLGAKDCRGAEGPDAEIVFNHLGGNKVSYAVEQVGGKPALTRRDQSTGCLRQVIAPGLASGYQLNGGTPSPAGAPITGTLHVYCADLVTECPSGNYTNLKKIAIALTTPTGYSTLLAATTRT
jgi:prepilin-type N-terminal cleavage/methylation domain-containing protein